MTTLTGPEIQAARVALPVGLTASAVARIIDTTPANVSLARRGTDGRVRKELELLTWLWPRLAPDVQRGLLDGAHRVDKAGLLSGQQKTPAD